MYPFLIMKSALVHPFLIIKFHEPIKLSSLCTLTTFRVIEILLLE